MSFVPTSSYYKPFCFNRIEFHYLFPAQDELFEKSLLRIFAANIGSSTITYKFVSSAKSLTLQF